MNYLPYTKAKKLLNIDNNAKTVKGQKQGYMTAILYLDNFLMLLILYIIILMMSILKYLGPCYTLLSKASSIPCKKVYTSAFVPLGETSLAPPCSFTTCKILFLP